MSSISDSSAPKASSMLRAHTSPTLDATNDTTVDSVHRISQHVSLGLGLPTSTTTRIQRRKAGISLAVSRSKTEIIIPFEQQTKLGLGCPPTTLSRRSTARRVGGRHTARSVSSTPVSLSISHGRLTEFARSNHSQRRRVAATHPPTPAAPAQLVGLGFGQEVNELMGWQQSTGRRRRASDPDTGSIAGSEEEFITYSFLPPGLSTPMPSNFGEEAVEFGFPSAGPRLLPVAVDFTSPFDADEEDDEEMGARTPVPGAPLLPSISTFEWDQMFD